ncbi:MAG: SgcJ/EcaC family oxidoreductase [Propionibacteriaceae bacterium]|nr:SgcJ/EcaC family oxidoreductase [Propionibacteriaceae bacterium]
MTKGIIFGTAVGALFLLGCNATATTAPTPASGSSVTCTTITKDEAAKLFDRWNASLAENDPAKVVENYAQDSLLLPTLSDTPRFSAAEKEDYFKHFLESKPSGKIDQRFIDIGCNYVVDSGHYTFTLNADGTEVKARYTFTYEYTDGKWLITSHHSSVLPKK